MQLSWRFCGQGRRGDAGRVTSAVDTGIAVNPDTVMAQLQGGLVFGLTARLYGDETSATASIPALRNAIYAATGVALRRMPVQRNLLKVARIWMARLPRAQEPDEEQFRIVQSEAGGVEAVRGISSVLIGSLSTVYFHSILSKFNLIPSND
jgi:hypothetical protein